MPKGEDMRKKAVTIVRDPALIKILSDLVRREILRLLSAKPQTSTRLAERLKLSKTSTGYHLQKLLEAGFVKVSFTKVDPHGILEKYYEPTSTLFIEDFDSIPLENRRYFVHGHIERLRGMISAFRILGGEDYKIGEIDPEEITELAQEMARRMARIGERLADHERGVKRENLIIEIYSETLKSVISEERWRRFFPTQPKYATDLNKLKGADKDA